MGRITMCTTCASIAHEVFECCTLTTLRLNTDSKICCQHTLRMMYETVAQHDEHHPECCWYDFFILRSKVSSEIKVIGVKNEYYRRPT